MAKPVITTILWVSTAGIDVPDFQMDVDGRRYKVEPTEKGSRSQILAFLNHIKRVCIPRKISPFTYPGLREVDEQGKSKYYRITRLDEPEQMSLKFAKKTEMLAAELSARGLDKAAKMLKPVATRFRKAWLGPKSIAFFDDLGNENIEPTDAMAVLDAFETGAAEGPQVSQITGFDEPMCVKVISLAKKHLLKDEDDEQADEKA